MCFCFHRHLLVIIFNKYLHSTAIFTYMITEAYTPMHKICIHVLLAQVHYIAVSPQPSVEVGEEEDSAASHQRLPLASLPLLCSWYQGSLQVQ